MSTCNKVGAVFTGHYDEATAHDSAIKPGHLITKLSTGKVDGHGTSGGAAYPVMFAFEDRKSNRGGDGITAPKNLWDAYAADDVVPYGIPNPGDIITAWLPANASAVVIGSSLMSNGDGCLALRTSTNVVIATAEEAIDNSAGSSAVRIAIRIV
jgi:hypothetical protein